MSERKTIAIRFANFIADRIKRHPHAPILDFYIVNNWLQEQPENDVKICKLFYGKPLNYEEMLKRKEPSFTLNQVEAIARESVENSHHRIAEAPAFNDEWFAKKAKEIGG